MAAFALAGAAAVVGPTRAATALAGLVPTSGGTDWADPDARSGVNDGDNEVGASERPQSVGFTDSEVYLETDRPSLYDAFNESYGEPFRKTKQDRMVALGPQNVGEQKERPAENLQAGREFSAVRRKPEPLPRRPGERAAKALVYVKGPTPLHLPLAAYSHFDGTTWREEPCCDRHLDAELEPHSSWLVMRTPGVSSLAGSVSHQVKIGTLDSSPMPLPPHVTRFRVGSVNRPDFFAWAQFGIVRMADRTVPAGTVIDCEARTVDPDRLRPLIFAAHPGLQVDHHLSFHGDYAINPDVAALARLWVAGVPEGWAQVEAVVEALRRGYAHDRSITAAARSRDVVADFLLGTRRGPDYLFASSAVVLLRSLGYPSRVVSGLYAAPGRYVPRTRHTPVTGEDVHVWAEVRLPDGLWVAVEPTPGYELMPPVRSWAERAALVVLEVIRRCRAHPVCLLAGVACLALAVARRREICERLATLAYRLRSPRDTRRHVLETLRLIESRARWSGRPRPQGLTPGRWYHPATLRGGPGPALERLIRLADWAGHAPDRNGVAPLSVDEIRVACRTAVHTWTLARFRETYSPVMKEATTS